MYRKHAMAFILEALVALEHLIQLNLASDFYYKKGVHAWKASKKKNRNNLEFEEIHFLE